MTQGAWIDLERWKRREHFALYRDLAHPFWSVTVEVDVTATWNAAAQDGRSFFLASAFAALGAVHETEPLRLRLRPEGVWCHDRVGLSTTVLRADETFAFAVLRPRSSFDEFEADARAEIAVAENSAEIGVEAPEQDDRIYHSTLPWIRFTSFTNPVGRPDDCIPRLVFGRAVEEGGRRRMPVGVEVHHALVDGLDVARFLERFEKALARPLW